MSERTVLIADDEDHIRQLVRLYLVNEGFCVIEAKTGREALRAWREQAPRLIILDIMMPELDGREVLQEIRKEGKTPVIMLTAKDAEMDKVYGLELGADDYVTKPFSPRELVSRVKAVLRRAEEPEPEAVSYPGLTINKESREVIVSGERMTLPPKEFDLLWLMATNPNKVFSREYLLEKVWEYTYFGDIRTVDVHVRRLRQKVEKNPEHPEYIKTAWGAGYKFEYHGTDGKRSEAGVAESTEEHPG
ncbi:MAG: response regulator transcription factor [Bacillota bacterium]